MGSIVGATLGGIIIGLVESVAAVTISSDWKDVVVFFHIPAGTSHQAFRPDGQIAHVSGDPETMKSINPLHSQRGASVVQVSVGVAVVARPVRLPHNLLKVLMSCT